MEKLRSLSGRYPYRCYDCQTRFFAYRSDHLTTDDEPEGSTGENAHQQEKRVENDEEAD